MKKSILTIILAAGASLAFAQTGTAKKTTEANPKFEIATFGNGCFWCTEAIFVDVKGVQSVESGYAGGKVKNPSYEQVCTGTTGHAESLNIVYDPSKVTYSELLEVFWNTHTDDEGYVMICLDGNNQIVQ